VAVVRSLGRLAIHIQSEGHRRQSGGTADGRRPLRIETSSIAGRLSGAITLHAVWDAPEPGELLVSGVALLVALGRRRMRR
jgi:hypothetical protein